ncbi:hypothetical protein F4819DRAFT_506218 [Hypoxylon fuscum]|nr:hypothetical protein F4819DRAFT_506218 [Hypoxylon fuscum]
MPTGSSVVLGPLTTTWTPPPACSIVVAACSACSGGWQAQTCPGSNVVQDNPSCWPPRTSGASTPEQPFLAWGLYSPASICPYGYSTACSYNGALETGDFNFYFQPKATETVIGCCPTGYTCSLSNGGYGQTCTAQLTSTSVPTVTCESGTSAQFEWLTIPYAVATTDSVEIVSTFIAYAPLFQLNNKIADPSSFSSTSSSSGPSSLPSTPISLATSVSSPNGPSESSLPRQGLSTGAQAGIGCGVGLGAILIGAVAFCLFRSRRRNRGETEIKHEPAAATQMRVDRYPAELEAHHHGVDMRPY